jgi:tRNA C32,U32 (ribose-2'-O)-methylase TrmJ
VLRLPTPGPVDSFNLASSVAVTLTLLTEAMRAAPSSVRATSSSYLTLREALEQGLDRRGFYKGRSPAGFRPRLDELLGKMDLSPRDVELLTDLVIALAGPSSSGSGA